MTVTDPIRQVSVVSTGQVQVRPDHLPSTWRPAYVWLLSSRSWTGPRPINACAGTRSPQNPPVTPALPRSGRATTCSGTAASSCYPPGHTPGSMSLLVRRPGRPPLIMVGDVTYDAHLLEVGYVPGVGSRRRLREATVMINKMRQQYPGLVILPAGGPGAAGRLAQATGQAPTLASA